MLRTAYIRRHGEHRHPDLRRRHRRSGPRPLAARGRLHGDRRGARARAAPGRPDRRPPRRRTHRHLADGPDGAGPRAEPRPEGHRHRRLGGPDHLPAARRRLRRRGHRLRDRDPPRRPRRLLYEDTAPYTEYLFDDTVTALAQDADGVTVDFERAGTRRYAAVIGADGMHSVVRGLAFGPESQCVRPLDLYLAWFTAETELDLDGWYLMHNAPGGLVASVRPGRLPGEVKAGFGFRSGPLEFDRRDTAAQQELVARRFAGVGWETPRLLDAMRRSTDFHLDSLGQVHLDTWSRGRVALLGDAGHCPSPLTGLGTSLALVGAYVLARRGGRRRRRPRRRVPALRPGDAAVRHQGPGAAARRRRRIRPEQRAGDPAAHDVDAVDEPLADASAAGRPVRQGRRHRPARVRPPGRPLGAVLTRRTGTSPGRVGEKGRGRAARSGCGPPCGPGGAGFVRSTPPGLRSSPPARRPGGAPTRP
ncbi:FAD-dependent monooxygenase [Kitasatospora arboriphila]